MESKAVKRIPPEEFIRVWVASASIQEVCRMTGMNRKAALVRARDYRSRGIDLPHFQKRGRPSLNIERLQNIAAGKES